MEPSDAESPASVMVRHLPPLPLNRKGQDIMLPEPGDVELDTSAQSQHLLQEETEPNSRATQMAYIAPALPPIRFSMNSADFSDLLNNVSGLPREQLSQIPQRIKANRIPLSENVDTTAPLLTKSVERILAPADAVTYVYYNPHNDG